MNIVRTIPELKAAVKQARQQNRSIGFVPTMGFLHDGHLSLVSHAKAENDLVIMSIFVNPLQFGPNEDFDRYPRDEKRDTELAAAAGVDVLFLPAVADMYPEEPAVTVTVHKRTNVLCGLTREGHFDGVATVVMKLFHLTEPDRAYFGQKDAQQLAVIHGLVDSLNVPVRIKGVPTVREPDGLAKSSRNVYLSESERQQASSLYKALQRIQASVAAGERNAAALREAAWSFLTNESGGDVEYVEMLTYPSLEPVDAVTEQAIAAVAVRYEKARLIDNILLNGEES